MASVTLKGIVMAKYTSSGIKTKKSQAMRSCVRGSNIKRCFGVWSITDSTAYRGTLFDVKEKGNKEKKNIITDEILSTLRAVDDVFFSGFI